jgi:hypothetical protein
MKKRLIITEEEKSRILGLHKSLMMEQPVSDPKEYERNIEFNKPINTKLGGVTNFSNLSGKSNQSSTTQKKRNPKVVIQTPIITIEGTYEGKMKTYFGELEVTNFEKYDYKVTADDFVNYTVGLNFPQETIIPAGKTVNIPISMTINPELNKLGAKPSQRSIFTFMERDKKVELSGILKFKESEDSSYQEFYFTINFTNVVMNPVDGTSGSGVKTSDSGSQGVTNPEQAKTEEKKENIVTNFDRKYNYKKEGDKYFYQLKSAPDKWIEATNPSAKSAIGVQVFKDKGACIFPKDPCPGYDGKEWENSSNTEQDKKEKNIGFCTTNYCSAKYVQDTLNAIITDEGRKGHEKLKGQKTVTVDGKFGTQTQNLVYKLLSKLTTTPQEVVNMWKED